MGSEDVLRASHNIQSAASDLNHAAQNLQSVFELHERFLMNWLVDFQTAMEAALTPKPAGSPAQQKEQT